MPQTKEEQPPKKKREAPKELCGCGVDTYRPPPKGKKKKTPPIEHALGCVYQRTVCNAYPHLPKCVVCLTPCKHCAGTNRWCPHCYENRCTNIYKRIVHGHDVRATQQETPVRFFSADGNNTNVTPSQRNLKNGFQK